MPVGYPNQNGNSSGAKSIAVTVATTTNINLNSAAATYDGYTMSVGNTILVWQQTPDSGNGNVNNGIYTWNALGQPLTRTTDFTIWDNFIDLFISISQGNTLKGQTYISNARAGGVLGTSPLLITSVTAGTVSSINGLTGAVDMVSPDNSSNINVSGKNLQITTNLSSTGAIDFNNNVFKLNATAVPPNQMFNGIDSNGNYQYTPIAITVLQGGTGANNKTAGFNNLSPLTTIGDLITSDGTNNVRVAGNNSTTKAMLIQSGNGTTPTVPTWQQISGNTNFNNPNQLVLLDNTNRIYNPNLSGNGQIDVSRTVIGGGVTSPSNVVIANWDTIETLCNKTQGQLNARVKVYGGSSSTIAYAINDIVSYLGKFYICIQANTGNTNPPDTSPLYWTEYLLNNNVTTQGNAFNGANQLLQLDNAGKIADARLSSNVALGTTTTFASATNTMTLGIGGVTLPTSIINSVSNTFNPTTNMLTTTINGVSSTPINIGGGSNVEQDYTVDFITYTNVGTISGVQTLTGLNGVDTFTTGDGNIVLLLWNSTGTAGVYSTSSTGAWTLIALYSTIPAGTLFNVKQGNLTNNIFVKAPTQVGNNYFLLNNNAPLQVKYIEFNNSLTLNNSQTISSIGLTLNEGDLVVVCAQSGNIKKPFLYRVTGLGAWSQLATNVQLNGYSFNVIGNPANNSLGINNNTYYVQNGYISQNKAQYNVDFFATLSNSPTNINRTSAFDTWTSIDQALNDGITGDARLMFILDTPNGKISGQNGVFGTQSNLVYGSSYYYFTNNLDYFNYDATINDGWVDTQFFDPNAGVIGTGNAGIYVNRSDPTAPWNTNTSFSTYWTNGTLGNASRKSIEIANNVHVDDYIPFDITGAEFVGDKSMRYGYVQGTIINPVQYQRAITESFGNTDGTSFFIGSSLFYENLNLYYYGQTLNHESGFLSYKNSIIANSTINMLGTQTNATELSYINSYFDFSTAITRGSGADGLIYGYGITSNSNFDISKFDFISMPQPQTPQTITSPSGTINLNDGVANVDLYSTSNVTSAITLVITGIVGNQDIEIKNIGTGYLRTVLLQLPSGWTYSGSYPTYNYTNLSGVNFYRFSLGSGDIFKFRANWVTKVIDLRIGNRVPTKAVIGINAQSYTTSSSPNLVWNTGVAGYNTAVPVNAFNFGTTGYIYIPDGRWVDITISFPYSLVPAGLNPDTTLTISTSNSNISIQGRKVYNYSSSSFANTAKGYFTCTFSALSISTTNTGIQSAILVNLNVGTDTFSITSIGQLNIDGVDVTPITNTSLIG